MRHLRRLKASLCLLLLITLLSAVGGNWYALQAVAWTRMAISFVKKEKVTVALQKTFDGKHPCRLCHEVVKQQKAAKSQPVQAEFKIKLDPFFVANTEGSLLPHSAEVLGISRRQSHFIYFSSPPTPPPKKNSFFT